MSLIIFFIFFAIGFSVDPLDHPVIIQNPNDTYTLLGKTVELFCEVDGNPFPNIQWYRDKYPVITHKDRPVTSKYTAQNGYLYIHDFKEDLQGSYYCNATNIMGSTASNNAIVRLAHISGDISTTKEVTVSMGETISLECIPPTGLPIPRVYWTSNKKSILKSDDRIMITSTGNLIIKNAEKSDSDKYYCVAENMAGTITSTPSTVNVVRKPQFMVTPSDKSVSLGDSVTFRCQVEGDPEPTIVWSRKDSLPISSTRSHILADKSLRIDHVQQADMGDYICKANNSALEASAHLYVKESPNFIQTPNDKVTKVGEEVIFSCIARGEPKPIIRWVINNQQYLAPSASSEEFVGRYTFSRAGSLRIRNVDKSDEGTYECRASQEAGIVKSMAKLTIIDPDAKPIPIIDNGPQNMNITAEKTVILNCKGRILDTNRISTNAFIAEDSVHNELQNYQLYTKWFIGGVPFNPANNMRIVALSPETLQINAIQESDQGTYECRLYVQGIGMMMDEGIYASARANIFVLPTDQKSQILPNFNIGDPRYLPEAPKSVDVAFIGDTWINLSWDVPKQSPELPINGYRVEYIEYMSGRQWVIAHYSVPISRNVTVAGLKPKTGYLFSVRSISRNGYGAPTLTSKFVFTNKEMKLTSLDHNELNSLASSIHISPVIARPVSKSEVQLSWNVCSAKKMLELISSFEIFYHPRPIMECIKYRPFMSGYCSAPSNQDYLFDKNKYCSLAKYQNDFDETDLFTDPKFSLPRVQDYNLKIEVKTDLNPEEPRVVKIVENLYPFVCYTFEVRAILNVGIIKSELSQSNPVLTFESIPSQAPENLSANWKNNGTILQVNWDPLDPPHTNGLLSKYSLRFLNRKTQNLDKRLIDGRQTTFYLETLDPEVNYTIHLAGLTCSGEGTRSEGVQVTNWEQVYQSSFRAGDLFAFIYDADWPMFLWLLLAGFGIIFFSTFLLFVICCYRRKMKRDSCFGSGVGGSRKKSSKFQHLPDNPMCMNDAKNFSNFSQSQEKNLLLLTAANNNGINQAGNPNMANYIMSNQQNSFVQNSTSPMALNKFSPTSNGNYFPLAASQSNNTNTNNNNSSSSNSNSNNVYTNQMTLDNSYADPSLMGSIPPGKFMHGLNNNSGQSIVQFGMNSSGNSNTSRSHGSNPMLIQNQHYPQNQYRNELDDTASPYASTSVVNGPNDIGAGEEEFPGSNATQLRLTSPSNYQGPMLHIPPPPDSPPPPVPPMQQGCNSKTVTTNTSNTSSHTSSSLNNNANNDFANRSHPPSHQMHQNSHANVNCMMTMNNHNDPVHHHHHNHRQQSSFHDAPTTNQPNPSTQAAYAIYQS